MLSAGKTTVLPGAGIGAVKPVAMPSPIPLAGTSAIAAQSAVALSRQADEIAVISSPGKIPAAPDRTIIPAVLRNSPHAAVIVLQAAHRKIGPHIDGAADLEAVERLKTKAAFEGPSPIGIMTVGGAARSKPPNFDSADKIIELEPLEMKWPVHFGGMGLGSVARQMAMLGLGTISEVEDPFIKLFIGFNLMWLSASELLPTAIGIPGGLLLIGFAFWKKGPRLIPTTGRGGLRYLMQLGLLDYDFSGKSVLDVGSGNSPFVSLVNMIFGTTGARAVGMDLAFKPRGRNSVQADARHIPFSDSSFDLVTNNWMFCHFTSFVEADKMMEEMLRVTKPGGKISISFGTIQTLEFIAKKLKSHPAVAAVHRGPTFILTKSLTITVKNPKPTLNEMREHYASMEAEGRNYIPWRETVFSGIDLPLMMGRLKSGNAKDRVNYVRWSRRLINAGITVDDDIPGMLIGWMNEHKEDELLRIVVATFLMERGEYRKKFKRAWEMLSVLERNMAMRLWLSSESHWAWMRGQPFYFELEAEFEPDVKERRNKVARRIEHDRIMEEIYIRARMRGVRT